MGVDPGAAGRGAAEARGDEPATADHRLRRGAAAHFGRISPNGSTRRTASISTSTRRLRATRCATATARRSREERVWPLLDLFFDREMHRQNVVPGAVEALARSARAADIVILTNIGDQYQANRVAQLEAFDIRHRVLCNRGGKGRPVLELIEEMRPSATVFVDDLAVHHESVAKHAPDVWRLHMIAEPRLAAHTPAGAASPMPGSTTGARRRAGSSRGLTRAARRCLRPRHDRQHLRPPRRARHRPSRARRAGRLLCARRRSGRPALYFGPAAVPRRRLADHRPARRGL